jgi:hypothetical protein
VLYTASARFPGGSVLDKLTKETFAPLQGETFSLARDGGTTLSLALVAVLGNGLRGDASREQFSLHFLGPAMPTLPQRIYQLQHQQLGTLDIFLVPIKRDASGTTYEAVFT